MQTTGTAALLAGALAGYPTDAVGDDRYQSIPIRNAFALREPPPPPTNIVSLPSTPPPKIVVTGLTDLGGVRKALLEISDSGKPLTRVILAEGDTMDAICVLRIDLPANRVKIRVRETESFLNLEAPKASASPAPPAPAQPSPAGPQRLPIRN
jgi:hypothetical protein